MFEDAALEVEGLEKRYRGFSLRVSFRVGRGEVLGVVGPNGAGKTTLIYCVVGLVKPDGGRVRVFGLDVEEHEVEVKRRMGVFLEEAPLFRQVRVRDVVKFFASFYPTWDGELAERLMREFELEGGKRVSELSKGMRAKLMLVTAVSHRPELLLLDEPTAGLDPGMRREFVEVVRAALRDFGPGILLTSHIMADVEDVADRVLFLDGGRVALSEGKRELLQRWRRIRGRGEVPLGGDAWVVVERDPVTGELEVVTDRWSEALLSQAREAGLRDIRVFPLNLEEIYSYVLGVRRPKGVDFSAAGAKGECSEGD